MSRDPRFTPDEQWTYHARPVDKGSTITITKIDNVPGIGFVIHFKVEHVTFSYDFMRGNDLTTASGPVNQTPYLALHRDSLDASAIQRIGIVDELELSSTYRQWRDKLRRSFLQDNDRRYDSRAAGCILGQVLCRQYNPESLLATRVPRSAFLISPANRPQAHSHTTPIPDPHAASLGTAHVLTRARPHFDPTQYHRPALASTQTRTGQCIAHPHPNRNHRPRFRH